MPINRTQLNRFVKLIESNKLRIDRIPGGIGDDNFKYTRAVSVSILEEYCRLNFQEAYEAVCDGEGDCKIDALYYSDCKVATNIDPLVATKIDPPIVNF